MINPVSDADLRESAEQAIASWIGALGSGIEVQHIREIPHCGDAGCVLHQTEIAIITGGSERLLRVPRPLLYVRKRDVEAALLNLTEKHV